MKIVGKQELEEIKKEVEWDGTGGEIVDRLIHTVEVLSKCLADAQDGKVKVLSQRDRSRKALNMAIYGLLKVKGMTTSQPVAAEITACISTIEKAVGFEGLPLDLLQKLSEIK